MVCIETSTGSPVLKSGPAPDTGFLLKKPHRVQVTGDFMAPGVNFGLSPIKILPRPPYRNGGGIGGLKRVCTQAQKLPLCLCQSHPRRVECYHFLVKERHRRLELCRALFNLAIHYLINWGGEEGCS